LGRKPAALGLRIRGQPQGEAARERYGFSDGRFGGGHGLKFKRGWNPRWGLSAAVDAPAIEGGDAFVCGRRVASSAVADDVADCCGIRFRPSVCPRPATHETNAPLVGEIVAVLPKHIHAALIGACCAKSEPVLGDEIDNPRSDARPNAIVKMRCAVECVESAKRVAPARHCVLYVHCV